jgi:cytochrome c oxidase assembly protein subunit 11
MNDDPLIRKNQRTGIAVLLCVLAMAALSFAAVPLYSLFCRVTGFDGTTQVAQTLPDKVLERSITVKFDAGTGRGMPWDFAPERREISLKIGERGLIAYKAKNLTDEAIVGTAVYNVMPLKAGKYFHKVQCFCFNEQTLGPHQEASLPVMFYVDPSLDEDPGMADVTAITLSYTFFRAESEELDRAMEAFYNAEDKSKAAPGGADF